MAKIEKDVHIAASIERVWAALTGAQALAAWMGTSSPPRIALQPGGEYEFFDGSTTGKITTLIPPHSLAYTWRQAEWPAEWADSLVRWELREANAGTQLRLTHTGFPNPDERDSHAEGWDVYWLDPMVAWLEGANR